MPLIPFDSSGPESDEPEPPVLLTGVSVSTSDREQILDALRLNRKMLHGPQPDAEVDEESVREAIDTLLDQLNRLSSESAEE